MFDLKINKGMDLKREREKNGILIRNENFKFILTREKFHFAFLDLNSLFVCPVRHDRTP